MPALTTEIRLPNARCSRRDSIGSIIERLSTEISTYPHFTVGLILAAVGATLVSPLTQRVHIDK
jgi:hypothetical protein